MIASSAELRVETNPSRTTCLRFADRSRSSSTMLDYRIAGAVAVKPSPYASKASRSGEFTSPPGGIKPPLHRTDPLPRIDNKSVLRKTVTTIRVSETGDLRWDGRRIPRKTENYHREW